VVSAAEEAPSGGEPAFYRGTFDISERADTFLRLDGWTKGCVFLNGFHLGRYWNRGPQRTLYIPAPLLRNGVNELIVFELHGTDRLSVTLTDRADLG
jgi:beta-galactosidase